MQIRPQDGFNKLDKRLQHLPVSQYASRWDPNPPMQGVTPGFSQKPGSETLAYRPWPIAMRYHVSGNNAQFRFFWKPEVGWTLSANKAK